MDAVPATTSPLELTEAVLLDPPDEMTPRQHVEIVQHHLNQYFVKMRRLYYYDHQAAEMLAYLSKIQRLGHAVRLKTGAPF